MAAVTAGTVAGWYGKNIAKQLGKKALKAGVIAGTAKLAHHGIKKIASKFRGRGGGGGSAAAAPPKFSKEVAAKGAVNMVKKGMMGAKGTHAGAYLPGQMRRAKEMSTSGLGGIRYAQKKLMNAPHALSYGKSAGHTKTRK